MGDRRFRVRDERAVLDEGLALRFARVQHGARARRPRNERKHTVVRGRRAIDHAISLARTARPSGPAASRPKARRKSRLRRGSSSSTLAFAASEISASVTGT